MKALFFDGTLKFERDAPVPEAGENEALVRVLMAGICGTDLEILKGYQAFRGIPGHEFVGVVEKVSGPAPGLVGKRVVGEINYGCGLCDYCRSGTEKHCPRRSTLGIHGRAGVFAEYVTLPLRSLWEVPTAAADEQMVFTEPLAAAFEVTQQVHMKPTDRVLVLGDGRLGLLVALVLHRCCPDLTLAGRHESKLAIAARAGIATKKTEEMDERGAYDCVVEATGSAEGIGTALDLVRPRGTVVLKSTIAGDGQVSLSRAVVDEVTLVGSRCGPFAPAICALASGRLDVLPLITAVYPFDEALEAFERARRKESIKVLLDFRAAG